MNKNGIFWVVAMVLALMIGINIAGNRIEDTQKKHVVEALASVNFISTTPWGAPTDTLTRTQLKDGFFINTQANSGEVSDCAVEIRFHLMNQTKSAGGVITSTVYPVRPTNVMVLSRKANPQSQYSQLLRSDFDPKILRERKYVIARQVKYTCNNATPMPTVGYYAFTLVDS